MQKGLMGVQMMMFGGKVREEGAYAVIEKLAQLGFRCVEISQIPMTAENVKAIKDACDACDVKVAACSAGLDPLPRIRESLSTDFEKIVDDCKTLNTSLLRIPMLPFSCLGSFDKALEFVMRAEEMAERLAAHDIELYYHNHHHEFEKYNGQYLMDIIRERTKLLGFELDVFWIQRGGENPVTYIREFEGRIKLLHLKDYRIKIDLELLGDDPDLESIIAAFNGAVQFAEIGAGSLPIKEIIDTGLACGSEYFLVEQDDTYGRDPFDCVKDSRDALVELGYQDWF